METTELTRDEPQRSEEIRAVPVRRPGRWIAAFIVLVFVASVMRSIIVNRNFEWGTVGHYMLNSRILDGLYGTLYLSVLAMVVGIIIGVVMAMMRLSPNPILRYFSWIYIFFFRGTPLLVQIVFWYNIRALFNVIALGVPFGPAFIHANPNTVITILVAALLALGTNEGAYMAEIVRAGIISVPEGQTEAAISLGMSRTQILRHVVLPQAARVILPPTGNQFISLLKDSSLASVIGFAELYYQANEIYAQNYQTIPLLIVISIWYLVLTSISYIGQGYLEHKFGQGFSRSQQAAMRERWFSFGKADR